MAKKLTFEVFMERINARNDVEYISGFVNSKNKVILKCKICGNDNWNTTPHDLFRPRYCPECGNKKRGQSLREYHQVDNYLENLLQKSEDPLEYTWLEEYSGSNKDLHLIRHNKCGHEYSVRPNDFQQGYRCPECSRQESEICKKITELLENNYINFEKEVKFDGLKNNTTFYKFDFRIDNLLIEIDGEQHFRKSSRWFRNGVTRERDLIKNQFVKDSNYRLLRIPYINRKDIPKILDLFSVFIESDFKGIAKIANENNLYYIYNTKKKTKAILNENTYYEINDDRF